MAKHWAWRITLVKLFVSVAKVLCSATVMSTAALFLTAELSDAEEESCREGHTHRTNTRDPQKRKEEAAKETVVPRQLVSITSESWLHAYHTQHRAHLSRQSSNCLSSVSSSPGDIPDLDLCPVQRQRSAIRNHVTLGIKDCWKRPWGQPTVEF